MKFQTSVDEITSKFYEISDDELGGKIYSVDILNCLILLLILLIVVNNVVKHVL